MPICPHCNLLYADTDTGTACCSTCGHPLSCSCNTDEIPSSGSDEEEQTFGPPDGPPPPYDPTNPDTYYEWKYDLRVPDEDDLDDADIDNISDDTSEDLPF